MSYLWQILLGTVTGTLSACGLGGGTLLLIYLVEFTTLSQIEAQGINLLYFLPTALLALPAHKKSGFLRKDIILYSLVGGLVGALFGSFLSHHIQAELLRSGFGIFLVATGIWTWKDKSS